MVDGGDQKRASGWNLVTGYVVGGVAVVLATIAVVAMISSIAGGDDDGVVAPDPQADVTVREEGPDVLPDGGLFKIPDEVDGVREGAAAADCELDSYRVDSNEHVAPGTRVRYPTDPPAGGRHNPVPAGDGAYAVAPEIGRLVHTLEHGRVIVWFDPDLPAKARASLKAYYDSDSRWMILAPGTTGMEYDVAATAWNKKPGRYGTGRLLGCDEYSDDVYTALEAFKKRNRGKGPELVP